MVSFDSFKFVLLRQF